MVNRNRMVGVLRKPRLHVSGWIVPEDEDPLLVAWWRGIPKGKRGKVIREALTMYWRAQSAEDKSMQEIQQALEQLRTMLNQLPAAVAARIGTVSIPAPLAPTPTEDDRPRLAEEEMRELEARMLRHRWRPR